MKLKEIEKLLDELSPRSYALNWDNPGLLVGREDKDVRKIFIALDADEKAVEEAARIKADLIITHHPIIFHSIKNVTDQTPLGSKIIKLIMDDISVFSMHTNFDIMGGMSTLAADRLGLEEQCVMEETINGEGIGRVGILRDAPEVKDVANRTLEAFDLKNVIIYGDLCKKVNKVAISPGSGRSMLDAAVKMGADCFITGDFGHHEGLDAIESGIAVIDASHAGIERIFIPFISEYLKEKLPDEVDVISANVNDTIPGKFYGKK